MILNYKQDAVKVAGLIDTRLAEGHKYIVALLAEFRNDIFNNPHVTPTEILSIWGPKGAILIDAIQKATDACNEISSMVGGRQTRGLVDQQWDMKIDPSGSVSFERKPIVASQPPEASREEA